MKKKILLILILALSLLSVRVYALTDATGMDLDSYEEEFYGLNRGYIYPLIKDFAFDEYGGFAVKNSADIDINTDSEKPYLDQALEIYDENGNFVYLALRERVAYESLTYKIYGQINKKGVEILEISHPSYVNYFRSFGNIECYTDGQANYVQVKFTNSYPATEDYDGGPVVEGSYTFKISNQGIDEIDSLPADLKPLEAYDSNYMPLGNWAYIDERNCLDFYNKYLLGSKNIGDQEYFKEASEESIGELYEAIIPLMDKNISPGKIDGSLAYTIYKLAISNKLVGPWIENSEGENFKGVNIYKDLEDQVASRDEEIFFPDVDKWSLKARPLREFFKKQYEIDLADGTYKYGNQGQVKIKIKEDQANFSFSENQIGLVSFPEIIGLRDFETYGSYAILKVGLLSTEGYYATDYIYNDNSYKNILITKTKDQDGNLRFIPLYTSDQDLDESKVKELVEEFKMPREEILAKNDSDKDLGQIDLVKKDQGTKAWLIKILGSLGLVILIGSTLFYIRKKKINKIKSKIERKKSSEKFKYKTSMKLQFKNKMLYKK